MWHAEDIAEALADGLRRAEEALLQEQAVHGVDALDEVELHPLLAVGAARAGWSVFRETLYPAPEKGVPKPSERERCDLVLAPGEALGIRDLVRERRDRLAAEGTLFAQAADPPERSAASGLVEPSEAYWLEIKTLGQYSYVDGIAGPNRTYASQFNACLADVRKLSRVRAIERAGAAIVLFTERVDVGEHDLAALAHRCLDDDLPLAGLYTRHVEITDRIGNRFGTVGVLDLRPIRGT